MSNPLIYLQKHLLYTDEQEDKKEVKEFVRCLEQCVNSFSFSPEQVYKDFEDWAYENLSAGNGVTAFDWQAYGRLYDFALNWVHHFGTTEVMTDPRNRYAVQVMQEVCQMDGFNKIPHLNSILLDPAGQSGRDRALRLALSESCRMHRTLFASVTTLMLYALNLKQKELDAVMQQKYGPKWYSCFAC